MLDAGGEFRNARGCREARPVKAYHELIKSTIHTQRSAAERTCRLYRLHKLTSPSRAVGAASAVSLLSILLINKAYPKYHMGL